MTDEQAAEKAMLDVKEKWMLGYDQETCFMKLGKELFVAGIAHERKRVQPLAQELEKERMRLAACGVAALQNTRQSIKERLTRNNPYWSDSYERVCDVVDREMKYRPK